MVEVVVVLGVVVGEGGLASPDTMGGTLVVELIVDVDWIIVDTVRLYIPIVYVIASFFGSWSIPVFD